MTFLHKWLHRLRERQTVIHVHELRTLAKEHEREAKRNYAAATEYRRQALELETSGRANS